MQDKKIIALFQKRSTRAIKELEKAYKPYMFKISYNILQNTEDANECLNDAYLKIWETIPPTVPLSLSSYIGMITRNISLDKYRHTHSKSRHSGEFHLVLDELSDLISDHQDIVDEISTKEIITYINEYLGTLTKEKRTLFILRYYNAYSIKDIAKKLSISESNVKTSLLRQRNDIKKILEAKGISI